MNKIFGIALLFFPCELLIRYLQIEFDRAKIFLDSNGMNLKYPYFFRKQMDNTLQFIFNLFSFFVL